MEVLKSYGRWETISEVEPRNGKRMILCRCTCENKTEKIVDFYSLTHGKSQSCGCLQKERAINSNKKSNRFEKHENCYYCYDDKGNYFIIDEEDYDKVKEFNWAQDTHGYWYRTTVRENGSKYNIKLHRFILEETNPKIEIDHINHKKYDNRKINLRKCVHKENSRNISKRKNRDVIGATWYKRDKKWESFITYEQKHIFLGRYDNKEDAIRARLLAEIKYFGNFAPQKHLFNKYNILET